MSDELRTLDAEFDETFLVIKKGIEKLDKEKEAQKMQAWSGLDHKLKGLEDTLKSYRLEIYELDRGTRSTYEKVSFRVVMLEPVFRLWFRKRSNTKVKSSD